MSTNSIEARLATVVRRVLELPGVDVATREILKSYLERDRSDTLTQLARDRFRLLSADTSSPITLASIWSLLCILVDVAGDHEALPVRLALAERHLEGMAHDLAS